METLARLEENWRTRLQPIRTAAEISVNIRILPVRQLPLYQKLAQKATELRLLGLSYNQIAKKLGVGKRTIVKAYQFKRSNPD